MSLPTSGTCAQGREWGGAVNVFVPMEGTMSVFGTKDEREEGEAADSHARAVEAAEQSGSSVTSTDRNRRNMWTETCAAD